MQYDMEISQIVDYILCDPLAGFLDSWLLNWTACWHPCASLQSVCCQGLPQEKQHPFHCYDQQCAGELFMEIYTQNNIISLCAIDFFQ